MVYQIIVAKTINQVWKMLKCVAWVNVFLKILKNKSSKLTNFVDAKCPNIVILAYTKFNTN